jgi:hypothetical protein
MGGIYRYPLTGYDARTLVELSMKGAGTVGQKAREVETRASPALKDLMGRLAGERLPSEAWDEVSSIPLTVFLFGFEGGGPAVSSREFSRSETPDGVSITTQRRDYGPNIPETVWLASPSTLAGDFVRDVPGWQSLDPPAMVKAFVDYAARKRPGTTGGSIDVLRIDRSGHQWLRRKTECMD